MLHILCRVLQVSLDGSLEGLWVRADDLGKLLAVLEEEEGRHGADAKLLGDVGDHVNIELVEARGGVFGGEPGGQRWLAWMERHVRRNVLDNLGRNDLAGPAPCSEAVKNKELILVFKGFLPFGLAERRVRYGWYWDSAWLTS